MGAACAPSPPVAGETVDSVTRYGPQFVATTASIVADAVLATAVASPQPSGRRESRGSGRPGPPPVGPSRNIAPPPCVAPRAPAYEVAGLRAAPSVTTAAAQPAAGTQALPTRR